LRGLIDAREAGQHYADLAETVLSALWPHVVAQFAAKHGVPPGRGAMVLGMGSLGAQQLSATSDLDVIIIYDAAGVETSDGRRPLAARMYYARLTQAFITALTAQTAEGTLYEVDMRLRPSGRQGPVATSIDSFRDYQRNEAWTWEHLALTRARPVAGDPELGAEVDDFRCDLLSEAQDVAKVLADVQDMRARLAEAKPATSVWEAKRGGGRLQDIELLAQTAALLAGHPSCGTLDQLVAGQKLGWFSAALTERLSADYTRLWALQAASKLLTGVALDFDDVGEGGRAFLLAQTGAGDVGILAAEIEARAQHAAEAITRALAEGP